MITFLIMSTSSEDSSFSVEQQALGEKIYEASYELFPDDDARCGKITGMLLEGVEYVELCEIVSDKERLISKIYEANRFYAEHIGDDEDKHKAVVEFHNFHLRFPGEKVSTPHLSNIEYTKQMSKFVEIVKRLKIKGFLPISLFVFAFNENIKYHSSENIKNKKFDNVRAFYIRMLIFFVSSVKFCLLHNTEFNIEAYMRSVVFSTTSVLFGPFIFLWESDDIHVFNVHQRQSLRRLYDELNDLKIKHCLTHAFNSINPTPAEAEAAEERKKKQWKGKKQH